jgi:hypothetical protein
MKNCINKSFEINMIFAFIILVYEKLLYKTVDSFI